MFFHPFIDDLSDPDPTPTAEKPHPTKQFLSPFADDRNYLTPPRTPISVNSLNNSNDETVVSDPSSPSSTASSRRGDPPRPSLLRKPLPQDPIVRHYFDSIKDSSDRDFRSVVEKTPGLFIFPSPIPDRFRMDEENITPRTPTAAPSIPGCWSPSEFGPNWGTLPSRYLYIRNLPVTVSVWTLREIFKEHGDIKALHTKFLSTTGIVVLAFYDLRHATKALRHLRHQDIFEDRRLDVRFCPPSELARLTGDPNVVSNCGSVLVIQDGDVLEHFSLKVILDSFGDISSFQELEDIECCRVFMAEYYDERHAVAVKDDLHDKTIEGTRFQIIAYDADVLSWRAISTAFKNAGSTTPVRTSPQPQPQPDGYFGSHWARNTNGGSPPTRHNFSPGPRSCGVRIPDLVHDYFSTQPATTDSNMATHSPPIHNSTSPSLGFGFAFDADPTPYPLPSLRPRAVHAHTSSGPLDVHTETELMRRMQDTCIRPTPLVPWTDGYFDDVPVPGGVTVSGPAQILATSLLGRAGVMRKPREIVSTGVSSVVVGPTMATLMVAGGSNSSLNLNPMSSLVGVIASRNELDLDRILMGLDIRTTFMIRNIPNKYTQQMLIDSINETHKGAYDFLYLRIDFKNKCNVGYAFINFIDVSSVISFAEQRVGKKWNRFNSDKRCTLSYANIQGKLALIEKFRNSNVMDEELSYRPKIFYTNGPLAGEEEPFPAPTISKETRLRLRQLRQRRYHTNPQCKPSSFLDYYRDDEAEGDIPEEGATADSMDDMIADGDVIGTEELGEPH